MEGGKTHLLLKKLRLIRLDDQLGQIRIITRSPEQYMNIQLEEIEVVKVVGVLEMYRGCCVVFDDMLESNQKLIDPFFTRGRHKLCDVYHLSQSYFDVLKHTIRNNSNVIILFRQTLKDLQHLYSDIAGLDMSFNEFKGLCRGAWKEKDSYQEINIIEDENECKYKNCNESNPKYKICNPQTVPF